MIAWCRRSGRETAAGIIMLGGLIIATGRLTDCKPSDVPTAGQVEAGAAVADGLCKLVDGVDDSQIVRSICATVDEVATMVEFILMLRSTTDGGSLAASASCKALPGTIVCATSSERARAILFVSRVRTSRLMLDGGAR